MLHSPQSVQKRALKTHPDRLPQGLSEAERQRANEQFRLVRFSYYAYT
jgi:DnaJ homolog subfamily B member 6